MSPELEEPYPPRRAAMIFAVSTGVTVAAGVELWQGGGWPGRIAAPVFFVGLLSTLGSAMGWYDTSHPGDVRRQRVFGLAFLGVVFTVTFLGVGFLMLGSWSDSSTFDRGLAVAMLLAGFGMPLIAFKEIRRVRAQALVAGGAVRSTQKGIWPVIPRLNGRPGVPTPVTHSQGY